jgi:hypothetical protein
MIGAMRSTDDASTVPAALPDLSAIPLDGLLMLMPGDLATVVERVLPETRTPLMPAGSFSSAL